MTHAMRFFVQTAATPTHLRPRRQVELRRVTRDIHRRLHPTGVRLHIEALAPELRPELARTVVSLSRSLRWFAPKGAGCATAVARKTRHRAVLSDPDPKMVRSAARCRPPVPTGRAE